ncbi:hypothetical protein [Antrihabitans cavernicola]|uniref:Uncharacterized protein n=1 Tax=Antrihabitans cavernicola TaxID=2495913 RepID=A0A5A7SBI5_9NOCA|nr:hypothetical protein [Spelaeibacter cavernicola]KAA0022207.1 hypothetical protein FOY51_14540 [Spelaeibacter cavernicola]
MSAPTGRDNVRAVADAILYEGYLLYPYRSTSSKNRSRWQFGVLGPPGAMETGVGEEAAMTSQLVLRPGAQATVTVTLRFLQLQHRCVERADANGFVATDDLEMDGIHHVSWDEAVEREILSGPFSLAELTAGQRIPIAVEPGRDVDPLGVAGRVIRTRWPLHGLVELAAEQIDDYVRLSLQVHNTGMSGETPTKESAVRFSMIGAHQIVTVEDAQIISLLEPPDDAVDVVAGCAHHRCFPVLAGLPGDTDVALVSPIILYDYPEIAEQSGGALFDSTEIDEILSLRVMTLTEEEKAQARATDPLAAQIIDRCDAMSPESMEQLHGLGRIVPQLDDEIPWWTEEADGSVQPDVDGVVVDGVLVAKGTMVRLRPSRRADAQDLFYAGQIAKVATVHADVDGDTHVGVVLVDDPAGELHEWYGRYLYFAPDEVQPLATTEKEGSS